MHNETERKILDAAKLEFIQHGLRGARMQEIAERAGINKALLHYYFRNKEGLYKAALVESAGRLSERVATSIHVAQNPESRVHPVEAMVSSYMELLASDPHFAGLMLRELADGGKHLDALVEAIGPRLAAVAGGIPPSVVPLPQLMLNIMTMVWGTFHLQPLYGRIFASLGFRAELTPEFLNERVRWITHMVLTSQTAQGASDAQP